MPTVIKNNIGVIITITTYILTAAVSLGAAQVIISNLEKNQIKLETTFKAYAEKVDVRLLDHEQRLVKSETKIDMHHDQLPLR